MYGTVIQFARLTSRLQGPRFTAAGVVDTAGVWATCWAELEHRIGHSHVMNWFDPTKAHAVSRSIALCDKVYAPQGVTGESISVGGG